MKRVGTRTSRGWIDRTVAMKLPRVLLTMGLALVAMAVSCNGDIQPAPTPLATSPAPPPAAPELAVIACEALDSCPKPIPTPPPQNCPDGPTKTVSVLNRDVGGVYAFDPGKFNFSVGDCVEFTITAETEFHTFTVDGLPIDLAIDGGETVKFAFTFDKPDDFKLLCIPHESQGMVGTITVRASN